MENKVIPVLRIFDYPKAKEFYIEWLGFMIDWEHRFQPDSPLYVQVSRDHITLHLSEHHGDACPGAKVFIEFQNNKPGLEKAPWNAICMEVTDPFGNKLLFNERDHT
jgi:hypothetical protein